MLGNISTGMHMARTVGHVAAGTTGMILGGTDFLIALALVALAVSSNLTYKYLIALGLACVFIPLFVPVGEDRIYKCAFNMCKHIFSRKKYSENGKDAANIQSIIPYEKIDSEVILNKDGSYTGLLEVKAIRQFYTQALEEEPQMIINYLIKKVVLFDDHIEIHYNSPIRISPDDSQGFSFYKKVKNIGKRKILIILKL